MKQFLFLCVICLMACTADTWVSTYPTSDSSSVEDAVHHIDSLHLSYEDVTDENITDAILETADMMSLSDDELQAVVDHYAD